MMALAVVTSLQAASNDKFDKATGSRTVHNLLGMLDVPSAVEYIKSLVDHFYTIDVSTAAKMKAAEDAMDVDEGEEENPDTTVQIDEAQANEDLLNSRRLWAVNQIYSIARGKGPITEREDIIFAVLKFLFFHGFYELEDNEEEEEEPKKDKKGKKNTPKKEKKIEDNPPLPLKRQLVPALSEQVQQVCQERFFTLLGQLGASGKIHAGANASEEEKAAILESEEKAGRMSNGNLWVYALAKYQIEVLDKDQTITAVADLDDDEVVEARAAALTFVEDIRAKRVAMESEKVNETDKVKLQARRQRLRHLRAFELLLSHLLVQVNVDPVETAQYIQDLIQSYNKIFETKKSKKDSKSPKKSKKAAEDEEDAEESGPIEVVTDILVGLLFKPSAILRDVVELVFKNVFCDQLTPAALKVLVDSIKADPASLLGGGDDDEDEFDSEEEEDEEDGEEDEHEHEHEHSEEDSKKGKHAHKHDHDTKGSKSTPDKKKGKGKEESSSDSDDDDDEDDDGEAPQLTVAVPFVEGGDDDSDEGMTDEQMFAMDKQIISVLKANKDEKRKHKDTQQQVMHFKFRVLDLLDVFLKRQGTNPLVFEILWPLLQVIQKTAVNRQQGSLLQRISSTFNNKLCKNKVYPRGQDVDADALNALIPKFFDIAVKVRRKHFLPASTRTSLTLCLRTDPYC
jgi:DNA polymerase phi